MYNDGARLFVEVGPNRVLSNLAAEILSDRPHLTLAVNQSGRSGFVDLYHCLGQLAVHGIDVRLDPFFAGRNVSQVNVDALAKRSGQPAYSPTVWLVNGGRAIPASRAGDPVGKQTKILAVSGDSPGNAIPGDKKRETHIYEKEFSKGSAEGIDFGHSSLSDLICHSEDGLPSASVCDEGTDHVVLQFQQVMNRFLDVQKNIITPIAEP